MNLEQFPTSETAIKMLRHITGNRFYDNSYFGKWIFQVMGMELDDARAIIEELPFQAFVETATWGLRYHEEKYGLPVRENLSYAERRKRIYQKRNFMAPATPYRLEQYLKDETGYEVQIADVNDPGSHGFVAPHPNVFKIFLGGQSELGVKEVVSILNQLKQSHTSYTISQHINTARAEQHVLAVQKLGESLKVKPRLETDVKVTGQTTVAAVTTQGGRIKVKATVGTSVKGNAREDVCAYLRAFQSVKVKSYVPRDLKAETAAFEHTQGYQRNKETMRIRKE